jgi:hypothetical protein
MTESIRMNSRKVSAECSQHKEKMTLQHEYSPRILIEGGWDEEFLWYLQQIQTRLSFDNLQNLAKFQNPHQHNKHYADDAWGSHISMRVCWRLVKNSHHQSAHQGQVIESMKLMHKENFIGWKILIAWSTFFGSAVDDIDEGWDYIWKLRIEIQWILKAKER